MNEILIPILAVTIIGLICGVGLAVASHVMAVKEDERFPAIRRVPPRRKLRSVRLYRLRRLREGAAYPRHEDESLRPRRRGGGKKARGGARRGGGGCRAKGRDRPLRRRLRAYEPQGRLPRHCLVSGGKAVLRRQGHVHVRRLGFGDCAKVCPHDAIYWNNGIAAIDQSVCVGCGLCAKTCPQQVIAIIPQSAKTAVLCSNHDKGALTRKACSAGCIGCMKCVKTCEHDAVHVEGNLASVDYEKWCRLRRVRTGLPDRRAARSYRECRSEGLLNF